MPDAYFVSIIIIIWYFAETIWSWFSKEPKAFTEFGLLAKRAHLPKKTLKVMHDNEKITSSEYNELLELRKKMDIYKNIKF